MNRSLNRLAIAGSMTHTPFFSLTIRQARGSFSLARTTIIRFLSSALTDLSNDALEIRRVSIKEIAGSGVLIDGYFLQTSPVTITEKCKKTFRDTVFANITGGSEVYALFVHHQDAVVTVDKSMFCDIHLGQSFVPVYFRCSALLVLLRSCFYRLTSRDYTSFAISYYLVDDSRDAAVNQTTEAHTGEGVTKAGQNYRCWEKFVYISNNISHVSVYDHHQGITIGPVPEDNHHVAMNQVVETGTGAFFYPFFLDHPISVSKINFIDNNPVSPYGCFANDDASGATLRDCIFSIKETSVWFGTKFVVPCKFYLLDCLITGYIPPTHSYIDTKGLITTSTLSTVRVKKIREGICKGVSTDFTYQTEHSMDFVMNCIFLLIK